LNPERLAENIKGYCTEEIVGQHFAGFFSAEDVEVASQRRSFKTLITTLSGSASRLCA